MTAPASRFTASQDDGFVALDQCHRNSLQCLAHLAELVERVARNGADAKVRRLADDIVEHFSTVARRHHEDEERHVFPPLIAKGDPQTVQAVLRLQQDHNWIEEDWMEIRPQLDAIAAGQNWVDIDLLREQTEVFSALMRDHIALEESYVYPEARAGMAPTARHEMGREMAARRRATRAKAHAGTR